MIKMEVFVKSERQNIIEEREIINSLQKSMRLLQDLNILQSFDVDLM